MRIPLILSVLIATLGCGQKSELDQSDVNHNQSKESTTPTTVLPAKEPVVEKSPAEKHPVEKPTVAEAVVSQIKARVTPRQLEMGGPISNTVGIILVPIPEGEFLMGSLSSDSDAGEGEKPQHHVTITRPFYLSVHEVTQQQFEQVMQVRPWQDKKYVREGPDYPAVYVSRNAAVEFCQKLSAKEGVTYRLPTEAEWEYACRAGSTTSFCFGDNAKDLEKHAWFGANMFDDSEKHTHRVGQKSPNRWGLFDMHGNAMEWCQDWSGDYGSDAVVDPTGPADEVVNRKVTRLRILRGGSFADTAKGVRSARRAAQVSGWESYGYGFRIVRSYGSASNRTKPNEPGDN